MAIKRFFDRLKTEEEEYVEIGNEQDEVSPTMLIEVEKIGDFADSDRIQKKVRDGRVLLVKIKELKEKDMTELKRAIEKIKKTCTAINGDIAGIGDDWIVVTPSVARVHRESAQD
ncbi:MAG: cell division protein SepF [Candidatus Aenigmarchaeota archaeon]|nr:cell division protein SepF [Candidatus Aenigmarchaeota archaeon]